MTKGARKKSVAVRLLGWLGLLGLSAVAVTVGGNWLEDHPQHNPWAPLDLNDPRGWATGQKLSALRDDAALCREVLERSEVAFTALAPAGEGACLREDRMVLDNAPLAPGGAESTCPVAVGITMWLEKDVEPLARDMLGTALVRVEQLGTYNCRRIGGDETGRWSEHASGNAIDISAFVFADGRRISLLQDWEGNDVEARFLRAVRDAACFNFGTVLSPDYNAAHADHFHLDQGWAPARGLCR